jgi:predicted nucleic acid-binding protein
VRVALDTNVLFYAFDIDAGVKHKIAYDILERSRQRDTVIALQTLGELFHALTRRRKINVVEAISVIHEHRRRFLLLRPMKIVCATP